MPIRVTLEKVPKSVEDGSASHSLMIHTLVSFLKKHIKVIGWQEFMQA